MATVKVKSFFGKQFRLHSFSFILISKYKVQEVSTCQFFYLDLKIWVLTFVGHQSRGIQLSFTLGIIKWYLLVPLQFFTNSLFTFLKKHSWASRLRMCCVVCLVLAPALCMEQMEGKAFLTRRQISMFIWIKNLWWILGGKTKMGDNDVLSIIKYGKVWETWESIASEVMEKDFPRNLERPEKSLLQSSK